jgi:hypothetical protein
LMYLLYFVVVFFSSFFFFFCFLIYVCKYLFMWLLTLVYQTLLLALKLSYLLYILLIINKKKKNWRKIITLSNVIILLTIDDPYRTHNHKASNVPFHLVQIYLFLIILKWFFLWHNKSFRLEKRKINILLSLTTWDKEFWRPPLLKKINRILYSYSFF